MSDEERLHRRRLTTSFSRVQAVQILYFLSWPFPRLMMPVVRRIESRRAA